MIKFLWYAVWCFLGRHTWDEVEKEGTIKLTGPDVLFMTWGHQYGNRSCKKCTKIQRVKRSGFVGAGCEEPKWHSTRDKK